MDEGEVIKEALVREFLEETGIPPAIGKLLYIHQLITDKKEHLEFFFEIKNPTDYLSVDLTQTTHGAKEIEMIDFVDIKNTIILPEFLNNEPLSKQIENDLPVKFVSSVDQ